MGLGAQTAPSFFLNSCPQAATPGCMSHRLFPALASRFLPLHTHPIPPAWSTFLTSQVCLEYNLSNFDEERRKGMLLTAVVSKNCGAVAKLQLASRWP